MLNVLSPNRYRIHRMGSWAVFQASVAFWKLPMVVVVVMNALSPYFYHTGSQAVFQVSVAFGKSQTAVVVMVNALNRHLHHRGS